MSNDRSPVVAAALSALLPGLGQVYVGNTPTGVALLCTTAGIAGGIAVALAGPAAFRSWLTAGVLGFMYPFVWFPSVLDAAQAASGAERPFLSDQRRWYIILMLLTVGPLSLPMLWQSPRFSRNAKLAWTTAVILLFVLGVLLAVFLLPWLEHTFRSILNGSIL